MDRHLATVLMSFPQPMANSFDRYRIINAQELFIVVCACNMNARMTIQFDQKQRVVSNIGADIHCII